MSAGVQHHVYQIYYNAATESANDNGFLQLDNRSNERPDWAEYWPVRKFLLGNRLDPDAYYGFLSPKFWRKTGLGSAEVMAFLDSADEDVVLFSPFFDQSAFSINIFEQASSVHPGIYPALVDAFKFLDPNVDIQNLVMTSRDTVFCNFFVAKKEVWDCWLDRCERIFELCEANVLPLAHELNGLTEYSGMHYPAKVFLIERMISYLLATDGRWTTRAYNPMRLPFGTTRVARYRSELSELDALKIAYCETGFVEFLHAYGQLRTTLGKKMAERFDAVST